MSEVLIIWKDVSYVFLIFAEAMLKIGLIYSWAIMQVCDIDIGWYSFPEHQCLFKVTFTKFNFK